MIKYDWDIILDYYISKKYKKSNEMNEFINYLRPYVDPILYRPIEAIISEHKDILFGKGKSNKAKAKEVLSILRITNKVVDGTLKVIENALSENKPLKLNNYGDK